MIEVRGLTKCYGKLRAVDNVSFTVSAAETVALLGPNGSGKTTIMRCIVGLATPSAGEIRIHGIDVRRDPREALKHLSYLPQRIAFPENLTAREVLDFYRRLRKLPDDRAPQAIERARFNGNADRAVGELSGGMVQRLGIAVACQAGTPILIFDEPTIGLDPESTIAFREFIASLKRDGKTILFSSHVLADAELLADRVGILVGGRLVALETAAAVAAKFSAGKLTLEDIYLRYVREANSDPAAGGDARLPD